MEVLNPLMANTMGLTFRQPGDMGRYVADNDPGGIAAGFSNLEDYLAAGNKLPQPTEGVSQDIFGKPNILKSISNANFNTSPPGTLNLILPGTGSGILNDSLSIITAPDQIPDRYKEGFAEFYKQNPDDFMRFGGQAISFVTTPQGETIQFGDTGSAGNFRRYLESIGETPREDGLPSAIGPGGPIDPTTPSIFAGRPGLEELPNLRTPGLPPPSQMPPVGINNLLGKVEGGIGAMNPYDNQFNLNDRSSLNTFIDNVINDRLKEFFGGIMGMLDV